MAAPNSTLARMTRRIGVYLARDRVFDPAVDELDNGLTQDERRRRGEVMLVLVGAGIVRILGTGQWEFRYVLPPVMGPHERYVRLYSGQVSASMDMGDGTFVVVDDHRPEWLHRPPHMFTPYILISQGYIGYCRVYRFRMEFEDDMLAHFVLP